MIVDTLAKQAFFTTVRIQTAVPGGTSTGTGFVYNVFSDDRFVPVLVTNKHVIKGATTGTVGFVKGVDGQPVTNEYREVNFGQTFASMWVDHPDPDIDVTVMPLGPCLNILDASGFPPFLKSLSSALCPTDELMADLDVVEDVTFIGYPQGLVDTANHTPIVRQGITATPIEQDWNGKPQFLIDASVFPGSSGSPVFLLNQGTYRVKGNVIVGSRLLFLGILAAVHHHTALAEIVEVTVNSQPRAVVQQFMDLGIVYKWHTVETCIDELCKRYGIDRSAIAEIGPTPDAN